MFCPRCSHQQVSNDTRFCSRCGLPLDFVVDLLTNSSNQLQRERREVIGIGFMMATIIMLLNFMFVFGIITLPHLGNTVFLWIWGSFVIASLITGGFGLTNLIRSGFFKKLKERELRLKLLNSEQNRQMSQESKSASLDVEAMPRLVEPLSITETTTRELQSIPKQTGETSRKKESSTKA